MPPSINKEGRRPADSTAHPTGEIVADPLPERSAVQSTPQVCSRKFQGLGIPDQGLRSEVVLVFKEQAMHFPEFSVSCSKLRGLCRSFGMGVSMGQREVAECKAKIFPEMFLNVFNDGIGLSAVHTFKITIL